MQLSTARKKDKRTYFGVLCRKCCDPILFGVDPSDGNAPVRGAVALTLTCADSACGWQDDYTHAPVLRYRKSVDGAETVAAHLKK
jgi:hypothetical protein